MIAPAKIARELAANPGMDELTAYRAAQSRVLARRYSPDVRRAAIAARRGVYA